MDEATRRRHRKRAVIAFVAAGVLLVADVAVAAAIRHDDHRVRRVPPGMMDGRPGMGGAGRDDVIGPMGPGQQWRGGERDGRGDGTRRPGDDAPDAGRPGAGGSGGGSTSTTVPTTAPPTTAAAGGI